MSYNERSQTSEASISNDGAAPPETSQIFCLRKCCLKQSSFEGVVQQADSVQVFDKQLSSAEGEAVAG
jgi:hypothetical protein